MSLEELKKTEAAFRAASRRAEKAREARNDAVRRSVAEGMTHAQIAEATGLTRGRINQIVNPQHVPTPEESVEEIAQRNPPGV